MKKADVKVGERYLCKVSNKVVTVTIERVNEYGKGWHARNTETGREVRIKSAQRLRRKVEEPVSQISGQEGKQRDKVSVQSREAQDFADTLNRLRNDAAALVERKPEEASRILRNLRRSLKALRQERAIRAMQCGTKFERALSDAWLFADADMREKLRGALAVFFELYEPPVIYLPAHEEQAALFMRQLVECEVMGEYACGCVLRMDAAGTRRVLDDLKASGLVEEAAALNKDSGQCWQATTAGKMRACREVR